MGMCFYGRQQLLELGYIHNDVVATAQGNLFAIDSKPWRNGRMPITNNYADVGDILVVDDEASVVEMMQAWVDGGA